MAPGDCEWKPQTVPSRRMRSLSRCRAGGDQLEQDTGLGLIFGDVGDIVEDQQLVLVQFDDGSFDSHWTRSVVRMNSTRRLF